MVMLQMKIDRSGHLGLLAEGPSLSQLRWRLWALRVVNCLFATGSTDQVFAVVLENIAGATSASVLGATAVAARDTEGKTS